MPGKGQSQGRMPRAVWTVTVVADGTAAEAEAAAHRAQRLVAEWIRAGVGAGSAVGAAAGVRAPAERAVAAATHHGGAPG